MKFAICLLRVSSDKQFQDGEGINNQKSRCDYYAEHQGVSITQYFYEHYTGRKHDRLVLENMIEFVKANKGEVSLLIVGNIDRFTRAGAETYMRLKKVFAVEGVDVVDASGIIQKPINTMAHLGVSYEWSERSPSQLAEVIMAENANAEATEILTRCVGGQIKKARLGYQFNAPSFGYCNKHVVRADGKKVTIMEILQQEAKWIKAMFDLRAEGLLSDDKICGKINAMGFKSRTYHKYDPVTRMIIGQGGGHPLYVKKLLRIISRPVYCGILEGKWIEKPMKFPYKQSIVSTRIFNQANRGKVFISKTGKEYSIEYNKVAYDNRRGTEQFTFRHVITCPKCNKYFTGSRSRGKAGGYFGYYHCSKGHKYYGVSQKVFESTVANYIQKVTFKKKYFDLLKEVVRDVWVKQHRRDEETRESIKLHIETLKIRQCSILRNIELSTLETVRSALEAQFEELNNEIKRAEKEIGNNELSQQEIDHYFEKVKTIMEHPQKYLLEPSSKVLLKKSWNLIFPAPPNYQDLLDGTPKMSVINRLLTTSEKSKRQMAEQLDFGWNTFTKEVKSTIDPYNNL